MNKVLNLKFQNKQLFIGMTAEKQKKGQKTSFLHNFELNAEFTG